MKFSLSNEGKKLDSLRQQSDERNICYDLVHNLFFLLSE